MKYYDIEFYMEPPIDKWRKLPSFCCMRKSFAEGAWTMLKAHYNQNHQHRLVCDNVVIDTIGKQKIKIN